MAGQTKASADLTLTRPQAVRLLGIADRTFARLEAEGVLAPSAPRSGRRGSTFDAAALVAAFVAHRERQIRGSLESPRDRRDRSQAELNELRLAKERRTLLPRDQVVLEGKAFITALVAKLRALPARLARTGAIPPAAAPTVRELLEEAQAEMTRWSTHLDLLAAVKDEDAA